MKAKLPISLGLYFISLLSAWSQTTINYRFGITGGINASQVAIPSISHTTDLLGRYNIGATLEQRFTPTIALVYQLNYTRFGGSSKNTGLGGTLINITEYNYLALPILLRIQPKGERGFIEVGSQIGYYLTGRSYTKGEENQAVAHRHITKLNVGLSGGLGYQLGKHFVIDARYYYGMKKIYADYSAPDPLTGVATFYHTVPQYHRVYSLNMSYYFK